MLLASDSTDSQLVRLLVLTLASGVFQFLSHVCLECLWWVQGLLCLQIELKSLPKAFKVFKFLFHLSDSFPSYSNLLFQLFPISLVNFEDLYVKRTWCSSLSWVLQPLNLNCQDLILTNNNYQYHLWEDSIYSQYLWVVFRGCLLNQWLKR